MNFEGDTKVSIFYTALYLKLYNQTIAGLISMILCVHFVALPWYDDNLPYKPSSNKNNAYKYTFCLLILLIIAFMYQLIVNSVYSLLYTFVRVTHHDCHSQLLELLDYDVFLQC